jgi:hypothetical protein
MNIYEWLEKYFVAFLVEMGWSLDSAESQSALILAHGDKTYQ